MELTAILLAAGVSQRLGRAKQLLTLKGKSFLEISLEKLSMLGIGQPILVLGAREESIKKHLIDIPYQPQVAINPEWQTGMASSIQTGMSAMPKNSQAVLLWICDQPLIPSSHLQNLVELYKEKKSIIATSYDTSLGVPAIFPKAYFSELKALQGQTGARYLLMKYKEIVHSVSCREAAFDVDTEEDYRQIVDMN